MGAEFVGTGRSIGGRTKVGGGGGRGGRRRGLGGGGGGRGLVVIADIPFEFVSEVACACAVAEASHVESGSPTARHYG